MRRLVIIVILPITLLWGAALKVPFETLSDPLQKSATPIERLSHKPIMKPNQVLLGSFLSGIETMLIKGGELANAHDVDKERLNLYLKDLRDLAQKKEAIEAIYRQSLTTAIHESDKKSFEDLVSVPLDPLHHPRIRAEVITFYQKNYPHLSIKSVEALCDEQALENKSIQIAIEQEQAYEEHLRILKRSEVMGVKKTAQIGSRNSVILSADTSANGGVEFEAENLNPYTVTLSVDFESLTNLKSPIALPLYVEIPGRSKKKILELARIDPRGVSDYRSSYGWVRGSAFARHNDDYLYALPFAHGANICVSQGYHGETSHKGLSAYAIDFPVPIGTPIYAAREGTVVGSEGSSNQGGASPEYRKFANYVILEHSDGTMGNYYHLRQGGAVVKIGEKITKGQLIAYSGNTGYSSGPHLHFSVSKVDPVTMRRPMNLPVKIQTATQIVTLPHKGDQYTVQ